MGRLCVGGGGVATLITHCDLAEARRWRNKYQNLQMSGPEASSSLQNAIWSMDYWIRKSFWIMVEVAGVYLCRCFSWVSTCRHWQYASSCRSGICGFLWVSPGTRCHGRCPPLFQRSASRSRTDERGFVWILFTAPPCWIDVCVEGLGISARPCFVVVWVFRLMEWPFVGTQYKSCAMCGCSFCSLYVQSVVGVAKKTGIKVYKLYSRVSLTAANFQYAQAELKVYGATAAHPEHRFSDIQSFIYRDIRMNIHVAYTWIIPYVKPLN